MRRQINNLGDVQIALNDLFDQMELLRTKPQDLKGRQLTGIADAKVATDAVNLETMQNYVMAQLTELAKSIPPKVVENPLNSTNVIFGKNLLPKVDSTYSIGSSALKWLKGWFKNLNIDSLTASKPVKTDASKNLVSGSIALATADVSGVLPVANGGTGGSSSAAFVASFNTRTGSVSLTLGDVTGVGAVAQGAFPGGATVVLAKITLAGANGSLTVDSNGCVTAYTAPT